MQATLRLPTSPLIITHELFYGASQALRDYFILKKVSEIFVISHPIRSENSISYVHLYKKGKKYYSRKIRRRGAGSVVSYIVDTILSLYWGIRVIGKRDVIVCADPLSCMSGIILRILKKTDKVIFYSIDYVPRRFTNNILNYMYHRIETFAIRQSDECWDVSARIEAGRREFSNIPPYSFKKSIVPIGMWKNEIVRDETLMKYNKHQIIFTGTLLKKQGIDVLLEAISITKTSIPDISLKIIGGGDYTDRVKEKIRELGLMYTVSMLGWMSDQKKIRSYIQNSAVAIALYDPAGKNEDNFTYFSDPTKLKTYSACGVPVIMTDVPHNSTELVQAGCGVVVSYESEQVAKTLISLLTNSGLLLKMRKNAVKYIRQYTWENIYNSLYSKEI